MEEIKLGKYKHFKGREIEVVEIVKHSETMEDFVLYKHTDEEKPIWYVRPKKMFLENVERDGKVVPRFKYIGN